MTQARLNSDNIATHAGTVTVFNFDAANREYLSSSVEYLAVGVGIPANACMEPPLITQTAYAVCRSADLSQWEYVPDYRGEIVYNTENGAPETMVTLGDYPAQRTRLAPATPYDIWNGKEWVTDVNAQNAANINEADIKKQQLLTTAKNTISAWQSELLLGVISDEDKASLITWLAYIKTLNTVETSTAPDIHWPQSPIFN